jgi:dihydroflavonol-4-reductase
LGRQLQWKAERFYQPWSERFGKQEDAGDLVTLRRDDWLVRLGALRDPMIRGIVPLLGLNMNATSEKARRLLAWSPRSREAAIVATAESLIRLGLLGGSKRAA